MNFRNAIQLRQKTFLVLVVLTAFLLRLGAAAVLRDITEGPGDEMGADGREYNALALRVASGAGYSYANSGGQGTSFRAPGFPLFLAGVYFLFGENYVSAYLAFCCLGALNCLLTYYLAREVLSEGFSRVAALFAVFYFPHVYYATIFASENLFALCLAMGLWLFLKHLRTGSLLLLLGAAGALGWGALTRPFALLLLPVWLGVLVVCQLQSRRFSLVAPVVLLVGFFAIVLPWTLRNYLVHDKLVLIATNGGSTFYGGNNDLVLKERRHWGGWVTTKLLPGRDLIEAAPDEVSHDKMEWSLGFQWLREHLTSVPLLGALKLIRLWLPDVDSGNKKYVLLQLVCYTPFLLLYLASVVSIVRDRCYWTAPWMCIHGCIFMTMLTALLFWGSPRFRDANAPVLMVYASLGASGWGVRAKTRRDSE